LQLGQRAALNGSQLVLVGVLFFFENRQRKSEWIVVAFSPIFAAHEPMKPAA
jgi:hypothetical protein